MNTKRRSIAIVVALLASSLFARIANAVTLASDSASDPAYAAEVDGAWKGEYPTGDQFEQNPPGMDNGGTGFKPWSFGGGYHVVADFVTSEPGPYGMLNHFIDGVDFPTTPFNNLGAPAFGVVNVRNYGGLTSAANREFNQPLAVGDIFSAEIDTPAEYEDWDGGHFPFAIIGFRDADGNGSFSIEAGSSVSADFPWRYTDLNTRHGDFGVAAGGTSIAPTATSDGSSFRLEVLSPTTGRFTLDGVSLDITFGALVDGSPEPAGPPASVFFTSFHSSAVANEMGDPTGEHAFYFDNLKIDRPSGEVLGDYNDNGTVDAADYVVWRDTLNQMGMNLPADGNDNDMIDAGDYTVWRANFGKAAGAAAANGSVPEPTALVLGLLATFPLFVRRRRLSMGR
jgi:hypothetical protein